MPLRALRTAILCVLLGRAAQGQPAVTTLAGRVLSADGAVLAGANVTANATDADFATPAFARTDARGMYRITVARKAGAYAVAARLAGYVSAFTRVTVSGSDTLVQIADLRLARSTQVLPEVRTVATRPMAPRTQASLAPSPGENRVIVGSASEALSGDFTGDLLAVLGGMPGLNAAADANGRVSYSLAGLGSEQNRITINGADLVGPTPREGGYIRISTASYDPARAASAINTDWILTGANFIEERLAHLTLDTPSLQWTTPVADQFGRRSSNAIFSGEMTHAFRERATRKNHPALSWPTFIETSYQIARNASGVTTLNTANRATLDAYGIDRDSVARLLTTLDRLGIQYRGHTVNQREGISISGYSRVDLAGFGGGARRESPNGERLGNSNGFGAERNTYLLLGGDWSDSRGQSVGPATLSLFAGNSRASGARIQGFNSFYFLGDKVLNETRSALAVRSSQSAPIAAIPGATISIASSQSNGGQPFTSGVQAAGSGGAEYHARTWSWQTANETRWVTTNGRHELKVAGEVMLDRTDRTRSASYGSFAYNSLADFAANTPATFSRSVTPASTAITGGHAVLALGDVYAHRKNLNVQYGVRAESHNYRSGATANGMLDSIFGLGAGRLPSIRFVEPMVGVTWGYGRRNPRGYASDGRSVSGGIRDYRGVLSPQSLELLAEQTGQSNAAQNVYCVGSAVPVPAWSAYQASSSSIPSQCADGSTGTAFAQAAPPVSLLMPGYTVGHSWRSNLAWTRPLSSTLKMSLQGMSAVNTNQPSTIDLNFSGIQRFALSEEGGRPVYVSPGSIVGSTGALSTIDSRRSSAFERVNAHTATLRSRAHSVTAIVSYQPRFSFTSSGINLPFTVSYTLSDIRRETNGFSGTTGGDPRLTSTGPGEFNRHALLFSTIVQIPDIARVTIGYQLRSGVAFTPSVSRDINGDGLANDRAFVFNPASAPDTAIASGVSRLLNSSDGVASCLRAQLGFVAAVNSCSGPWTSSLNAHVTLNPDRFGLQNRGAVTLRMTNVLAGIDQWLHGPGDMRGWGQVAYADPTLLEVRGFDPVRRRYVYAVNPQFGNTSLMRSVFLAPFRITLDFRFEFGPNTERAAVIQMRLPRADAQQASADSATIYRRLNGGSRSLFDRVLEVRDSLQLTRVEQDSLLAMDLRHAAVRDSVYSALAHYLSNAGDNADPSVLMTRWHEAVGFVQRSQWLKVAAMQRMLTPERWTLFYTSRLLPSPLWQEKMDDAEMDRLLRRWQPYPE